VWAQSTELEGATGSEELGEGQALGVFPTGVRGKADGGVLGREGTGVGCEG